MLTTARIARTERGLLFRRGRFERTLLPGLHRFFDPLGPAEVLTLSSALTELDPNQDLPAELVAETD